MGTHTYAILEVPKRTYTVIRQLLLEAGYDHAVHESGQGEGEVIDMHGLALKAMPATDEEAAILEATEDELTTHAFPRHSTVALCGYVPEGKTHSCGIKPPADVCRKCLALWKARWPEYARSIGL